MDGLYLGMMTGTSVDGINLALVEFVTGCKPRLCAHHRTEIPELIRSDILEVIASQAITLSKIGELNAKLGACYADAVNDFLALESVAAQNICALGCHGQTVWHQPQAAWPFTLQWVDLNRLAAQTGITVVGDFRGRDIAEGGQGAPLAPVFHHMLFAHDSHPRLIINIGGIANISCLGCRYPNDYQGYDVGPGNVLLDHWVWRHQGVAYDEGGQWALKGRALPDLLQRLSADPFFELPPPKSTGREVFNAAWLEQALGGHEAPQDVQATLVALTASQIASAVCAQALLLGEVEVYLCGGGVHNAALLQQIRQCLPGISVGITDELGYCADWIEAIGFAWLARERLAQRAVDLTRVTGAAKPARLGAVYLS